MKEAHRALRAGTRTEHERLDALFGGFDLDDRSSYAAFLMAHAAALLPLEAALDDGGAAGLIEDWPRRRRGDLLVADLAELRLDPPPPVAVPRLDTDPALLGAIYVVEGSRLGGRMLARQVVANLPQSYLGTEQPPGNWARLLARIDALLYDRHEMSHAIDTARAVFASFEAAGRTWLSRVDEFGRS